MVKRKGQLVIIIGGRLLSKSVLCKITILKVLNLGNNKVKVITMEKKITTPLPGSVVYEIYSCVTKPPLKTKKQRHMGKQ